MKIYVFFKTIFLGTLEFDGKNYIYNSNLSGEKEFKEKFVSSEFYALFNSNNQKFEEMPDFLNDFLKLAQNPVIKSHAGIVSQDSDFEKLYKISSLKFDDIGFNLKNDGEKNAYRI